MSFFKSLYYGAKTIFWLSFGWLVDQDVYELYGDLLRLQREEPQQLKKIIEYGRQQRRESIQ